MSSMRPNKRDYIGHAHQASTMSKSTPISQLPTFSGPQQVVGGGQHPANGPFVNDQHRQIVAQAQHAVQNYTMPQSSSHDISNEDEATIQETLQYISGPYAPQAQVHPHMPGGGHPSQQQPPSHMGQQQPMQYDPSPPAPLPQYMVPAVGEYNQQFPHLPVHQAPLQPQPQINQRVLLDAANIWMPGADDVRVVVLGVMAFVLLSVLPIEKVVSKYVRLDSIPYSDVILKAVIMGIILYAGKRLLA